MNDDRTGERHARKVHAIGRQLRAHSAEHPDRPVRFKKRVVSHMVPKPADKKYSDDVIDISALDEILEIDPFTCTCTAEPGVTFAKLVDETLKHGLVPMVVPELKGITVGGAVTGCSLESSSFRVGGFHDTCIAYDVIGANGDVIACRPDNKNAFLFQMIHGSYGTLGVLASVTMRLVPAKKFVHVVYEHYRELDDFTAAIRRRFETRDVAFMDGMIHAPDHHVLSVANFVTEAPYTSSYDWTRVYYKSTAERVDDWLKTRDYFFRYDHGVTNVHPKSAVARLLLGKLVGSTAALSITDRFHRVLKRKHPDVTVDVFVPFSRVPPFLEWYDGALAHYPVWVVPYRRVRDYEWLADDYLAGVDDDLFVDFAVYGMHQRAHQDAYRAIEDELLRVQGVKTLISYNYYDEDTFWRIFNRPNHERAKRIVDPDNIFRDLYAKTCRAPLGLDDVKHDVPPIEHASCESTR